MILQEGLIERLNSEVRDFRSTHFTLQDDLSKLLRVQRVRAPEAVILYSSRILEALAAYALNRLKMPPSVSVFSNLELLGQLELFTSSLFNWAHTLRRLGNEVRHLHCVVSDEDAVLACLLLERWLEWYFCSFPLGPQVKSLTEDGNGLALIGSSQIPHLLRKFESPTLDPCTLVIVLLNDPELSTLRCSALFSLAIEMLLDREDNRDVKALLETALDRFPTDLRLLQLQGLWHSRRFELKQAQECLEPLLARSPDDSETRGILAGVLKRQWWCNPADMPALRRSHELYRTGWDRSRKTNTYLGINAATTALWLGDLERMRDSAKVVWAGLRQRQELLAQLHPGRDPLANYWENVSLAEVQLLLGYRKLSSTLYGAIFAHHPERTQNHQVAREQLGRILSAMYNGEDDVDGFLREGCG